jgi:hypothetical protein
VLAHPPYSPDLAQCDYWLFSRVKEHLLGKRFQSEDDINTAGTASLKRPSKDEYRAAIDRLPRRWEKCVDSALSRGHVCVHSGISTVFLSSILLLQ